jgi:hypothetical protein
VDVIWDPRKPAGNYQKHRIAFADAAAVLDDPRGITIEDRRFGEQRFVTVGSDVLERVLVVIYTYPPHANVIRLISARRATPSEKQQYHGKNS